MCIMNPNEAVDAAVTTTYDGHTVAFCCTKCRAKFEQLSGCRQDGEAEGRRHLDVDEVTLASTAQRFRTIVRNPLAGASAALSPRVRSGRRRTFQAIGWPTGSPAQIPAGIVHRSPAIAMPADS